MKSDDVYLKQILDSVIKIKLFIRGVNSSQFLTDQKTQSAVIMQLALIGELSKKISKNTQSHVDLPWKDIAGFRDRAIHDYYQIDLGIVWETISADIPILKKAIQEYLQTTNE
ncbi:hypothetical protein COV58_02755 [Candidatus Roizmanbacteria bacterium CG11_big_fil_rev_8_21_14_0_20_36_8]|uniref:DUF86 domain-containing protein n=2 Tax=Candidatus Roizmaniibacteriota TaxID=1752723 RepID=A0A2M6ITY9_9BACT|nr:MAG: hypothetical protein COV58_02755 [Candidatus Roizmanbacteria bacterium CG11_big_fil_rev_8_21_14_0_20_36_8]PIZ64434.1 MAG: hypothetical protein COY14_04760 [Candidatus Roizmanbacteria bacterium CG_4_10_14_0_2_um_filter_36_9]